MSHEIRTPMNGVLATAELLAEEKMSAHQHQLTRIIIDSGKTMMSVLNDILDFSKIEVGQVAVDEHDLDQGS